VECPIEGLDQGGRSLKFTIYGGSAGRDTSGSSETSNFVSGLLETRGNSRGTVEGGKKNRPDSKVEKGKDGGPPAWGGKNAGLDRKEPRRPRPRGKERRPPCDGKTKEKRGGALHDLLGSQDDLI